MASPKMRKKEDPFEGVRDALNRALSMARNPDMRQEAELYASIAKQRPAKNQPPVKKLAVTPRPTELNVDPRAARAAEGLASMFDQGIIAGPNALNVKKWIERKEV